MKILLVSEVFPPIKGGSGRWLWELYRRLPPFEICVAAGRHPDASAFDRESTLPITRLRLHFSNWGVWDPRGTWQYARALFGVNRLVSRTHPEQIHCGRCLPEGLLALLIKRLRNIPFVCYVHGEELTLAATSRELRRLTRRVLGEADLVIANSRHTRGLLVDGWATEPDKIVVMHPGVDTGRFTPAPPNPQQRAQFEWSNRRVVLTVGAQQKRKGQDMLIRALPAIRRRCPDVLYVIVGDGWEHEYLRRLVGECHVADLVQFRAASSDDELIALYQQCDLFALPNRQVGWDFEGFGIVLLEAQACGKPVIAGASGGAPETVLPGATGEVLSCEHPEPLTEAIVALLDDSARRATLGERARHWVVERFDWTVLSAQARELFARRHG